VINYEEQDPQDALHAGIGDQRIVTTLCPGGKERMRRLMAMIAARRVNLTPLVTHRSRRSILTRSSCSRRSATMMKVALSPHTSPGRRRHAARRRSYAIDLTAALAFGAIAGLNAGNARHRRIRR
jgi:hypothetical protein